MDKYTSHLPPPVCEDRKLITMKPKLLDEVREAVRARHYSRRTEKAYVDWTKRFILFHGKRHPIEMGEPEINQFLTDLAVNRKVSASTQNQALSAILFLYQHVLKKALEWVSPAVRAKKPKRLPVVLTRVEVKAIIDGMDGAPRLIATILYGAGLRLDECLTLRFKDIDFAKNQILVRDGKGQKDRMTTLPISVKDSLLAHPERGLQTPSKGSARRLRQSRASARVGAKVQQPRSRVGLAMGFSRANALL